MCRVTPRFGVKMEAEGQVWFDFFVYDPGSRVDLRRPDKTIVQLPKESSLRGSDRLGRSKMRERSLRLDHAAKPRPQH